MGYRTGGCYDVDGIRTWLRTGGRYLLCTALAGGLKEDQRTYQEYQESPENAFPTSFTAGSEPNKHEARESYPKHVI